MTKTFKRIIAAAAALIVLAGAACALVLSGGCSSGAAGPADDARNGVLNTVLDASGVKGRIDSELRGRAGEIAEQVGIPQSVVDSAVDSLDIEDWRVTSLPAGATETGTYTVETDDATAQITTYDDPSVVTIDAYGQSVTMEVPDSAQAYVPYLQYLEYLR